MSRKNGLSRLAAEGDPGLDGFRGGEGAGAQRAERGLRFDHGDALFEVARGTTALAGPPGGEVCPDVDGDRFGGPHGMGGPEGAGVAEAAIEGELAVDVLCREEEGDGAGGEEDLGGDGAVFDEHLAGAPALADDDAEGDARAPVADKGVDHGFEDAHIEQAVAPVAGEVEAGAGGGGGAEPERLELFGGHAAGDGVAVEGSGGGADDEVEFAHGAVGSGLEGAEESAAAEDEGAASVALVGLVHVSHVTGAGPAASGTMKFGMEWNPGLYGPEAAKMLALAGDGRRLMPLVSPRSADAELARLLRRSSRELFPEAARPEAAHAGLWMYFGFFDESHAIAQDLKTAEGSYWHGILHRMEPDAWNAGYWFGRVGQHPVFPALHAAAKALGYPVGGRWDAKAFIDACDRTGAGRDPLLEQVQLAEWQILFDYCAGKSF